MRLLESLGNLPDMTKATYDLVAQVPEGRVTTYGEVAKALGDIVASRFVGVAMSRNQDIVRVPCRRVIQSDGSIGGYTGGGPSKKIRLLRQEGLSIARGKIVDFDKVLFNDFVTTRPLKRLRSRQMRLKKHLSVRSRQGDVSKVAGIDVAYEGDHAFAAMVVFDHASGREVERFVVEGNAEFPYIPTYLAFRELPIIRPLMQYVGEDTIVMYDGNGILHPEGFGVASQLGVVFNIPTIGVAKRLLCGEAFGPPKKVREIRLNARVIGHAISNRTSSRPVYVSAGHGMSPAQAGEIALGYLRHRVPEPTRQAHIVAEEARRGTNNK